MYIYIYMYVYIYIYYVCICICICIYIYMFTCIYINACIRYMSMYVYVFYVCLYGYSNVKCVCVCVHVYVYYVSSIMYHVPCIKFHVSRTMYMFMHAHACLYIPIMYVLRIDIHMYIAYILYICIYLRI